MNRAVVLSLMLIVAVALPAQGQQSVLSQQFPADAEYPLSWRAGQSLGSFVYRMAQAARTSVVLELEQTEAVVPQSDIDFAGKTVLDSLAVLVTTDPRYSWREVSGVIVIRPVKAWTDPRSPLNGRVESVRWENVTSGTAMKQVVTLIYGRPVMGDEPLEGARTFSVAVASGSVLDVLIASARAHGSVMWSTPYSFTQPLPKLIKFSLGYRSLNIGDDVGYEVATDLALPPPSMTIP